MRFSGAANRLCECGLNKKNGGCTMSNMRGRGIGVACAILIGMTAHASAGERVQYASLGDQTRAPIGWVEFCSDNPDECRGGQSQPRDIVMSQQAWTAFPHSMHWPCTCAMVGFIE